MTGPRRHILPHEPAAERVSWLITGAIIAFSVLALLTAGNESAGVATTDSTDQATSDTAADGDGDTGDASAAEGDAQPGTDGTDPPTGSEGGTDDASEPVASERFTISASGDILIHRRVAEAAQTDDGYDFTTLFANVEPLITSADLAICHLEVPLSLTNNDLAFGEGGVFRAPNQLADALAVVGFDSCSVASNHAYDSGESSVIATADQLTRVGMPHVGIATSAEEAERLWQFDVNGVVVGHLAYTYGLNGREPGSVPNDRVAQIEGATILADAARHKAAGTDFVVVSMHWGDEFTAELTDQQAELGPELIASPDIDLMIGHSAHVPQRIDEIEGEYIAYGLGNLLSNQSINAPECPTLCTLESQDGALVDFVVDRRADGSLGVVEVVAHPTWVDVGTTWQIFPTTGVPLTGAAHDAGVLAASYARTIATLGVPGDGG